MQTGVTSGRAPRLKVVVAATLFGLQGAPFGFSDTVTHLQNVVADAIVGPQFSDAAMSLERYHQLSGSYDGADVTGLGITLRWTTGARYCIDGHRASGAVEHVVGPNGATEAGPCPVFAF